MGRTVCTEPQCLYKGALYLCMILCSCQNSLKLDSLLVFFKLFVPCIFSTYGIKTNWCHYFIRILLDLYMFRAHRPIFRRVRTAVHTTIGSVSVPLCSRAGRHRNWTNGCVNSCTNSPEDGPVDPKHVEIQQYMNKIVTSVGFHSICYYWLFSHADVSGSNPVLCTFTTKLTLFFEALLPRFND